MRILLVSVIPVVPVILVHTGIQQKRIHYYSLDPVLRYHGMTERLSTE